MLHYHVLVITPDSRATITSTVETEEAAYHEKERRERRHGAPAHGCWYVLTCCCAAPIGHRSRNPDTLPVIVQQPA